MISWGDQRVVVDDLQFDLAAGRVEQRAVGRGAAQVHLAGRQRRDHVRAAAEEGVLDVQPLLREVASLHRDKEAPLRGDAHPPELHPDRRAQRLGGRGRPRERRRPCRRLLSRGRGRSHPRTAGGGGAAGALAGAGAQAIATSRPTARARTALRIVVLPRRAARLVDTAADHADTNTRTPTSLAWDTLNRRQLSPASRLT